jgi:hypothetical protein
MQPPTVVTGFAGEHSNQFHCTPLEIERKEPMNQRTVAKCLPWLIIASLVALLYPGMSLAQPVLAQEMTTTSDLLVKLVSMPKSARACDVFQVIFTVKNLGPDLVTRVDLGTHLPDAYNEIAILGSPYYLDVGETATFSAVIWVGGFEPGENRRAWVGVGASLPADGIDPDLDNNRVEKNMKIVSEPVVSCLPRH